MISEFDKHSTIIHKMKTTLSRISLSIGSNYEYMMTNRIIQSQIKDYYCYFTGGVRLSLQKWLTVFIQIFENVKHKWIIRSVNWHLEVHLVSSGPHRFYGLGNLDCLIWSHLTTIFLHIL